MYMYRFISTCIRLFLFNWSSRAAYRSMEADLQV